MLRPVVVFACVLSSISPSALTQDRSSVISFGYEAARAHEIKPHRRNVPFEGVTPGFNVLNLTLTVSPRGEVIKAEAAGNPADMRFWPQLQGEVAHWKFIPFENNGQAVTAEVEEYLHLDPPERLPNKHVTAPALRRNSEVLISLERTDSSPAYRIDISRTGIMFDGQRSVVAPGKHMDSVAPGALRKLAKRFLAADFYSMDPLYRTNVSDTSTYVLTISIDGHTKKVLDHVGSWQGMPAVITDLENAVEIGAHADRWINGSEGLVRALQTEKFNFQSLQAQVVLKEAASRGQTKTVADLLAAGVSLTEPPFFQPHDLFMATPGDAGWLMAASDHAETLEVLMNAGASKDDQTDKELALIGAAKSGNLSAVRALIKYGANPNANLNELLAQKSRRKPIFPETAEGSVLLYAAKSGSPEVVQEILRYHPDLEARDREGRTAVFTVGERGIRIEEYGRIKSLRLLAEAGANVRARDNAGNTPLHVTMLAGVQEELLKLGADVNAVNKKGETPIFTAGDWDSLPLLIKHGADPTIRNNKGETVTEANRRGRYWGEALRKAIDNSK